MPKACIVYDRWNNFSKRYANVCSSWHRTENVEFREREREINHLAEIGNQYIDMILGLHFGTA